MEIIIRGEEKEIAGLVLALQGRHDEGLDVKRIADQLSESVHTILDNTLSSMESV